MPRTVRWSSASAPSSSVLPRQVDQGSAQPHALGDPALRPPMAQSTLLAPRRRAVRNPRRPSSPPCQRCGCCCQSSQPAYIRLFEVDRTRLGELGSVLVREGALGPEMRFDGDRCQALRLDVATGRWTCTIHAVRPDACRWLTPASDACRTARSQRTVPCPARPTPWAAAQIVSMLSFQCAAEARTDPCPRKRCRSQAHAVARSSRPPP